MHCGRAQRPSLPAAAAAATAAAVAARSSPPRCSGLRIPFLAAGLRPSSSLPPGPLFGAKFQMPAAAERRGPRLEAGARSLGDSPLPASRKKSKTLSARSELASLTPPPAGCWGEGAAGRAGAGLVGAGGPAKVSSWPLLKIANGGFSPKVENQPWREDVTPCPRRWQKGT